MRSTRGNLTTNLVPKTRLKHLSQHIASTFNHNSGHAP